MPATQSSERLFSRATLAITVVMLLAFAFALHSLGRIPSCECGLGLVTVSAWSTSTSQHLLDPYSFSHVLHGVGFYALLILVARRVPKRYRFVVAILLEVAWEILENSPFIINRYRAATASLDYYGDSILNSMGDVLSTMLGFWCASRFSWKVTLAFVVVIELLMLVTIKDNLTLNIIMLLYPLDAIKQWQLR